jgi:hypothetical protein
MPIEHEMADMKITPFFKSFCLERDEKRFNFLEKQLVKNNRQIEQYWNYAFDLATKLSDKEVLAHYYQFHGDYLSMIYNRKKINCITTDKVFSKVNFRKFMIRHGYDRYFMYSTEGRQELKSLYSECISDFKKAIFLFTELKKIEAEAYCRYNYAIHLKMFGSFRAAKKQLSKVLLLLKKSPNQALKNLAEDLIKKNKLRNKDYSDKDLAYSEI